MNDITRSSLPKALSWLPSEGAFGRLRTFRYEGTKEFFENEFIFAQRINRIFKH